MGSDVQQAPLSENVPHSHSRHETSVVGLHCTVVSKPAAHASHCEHPALPAGHSLCAHALSSASAKRPVPHTAHWRSLNVLHGTVSSCPAPHTPRHRSQIPPLETVTVVWLSATGCGANGS